MKRGRGLRAPRTPSRRAPPMHWGAVLWPQRQSICTQRRACMRRRCADLLQRQVLMSRTFKVLLQRSDEGEHEGSDLQRGVFPVSGKRCLRQVRSSNSTFGLVNLFAGRNYQDKSRVSTISLRRHLTSGKNQRDNRPRWETIPHTRLQRTWSANS